ncbi:hypothetical protein [Aurantiacibacter rhizosphaerae]|uniref:Uncharacterized protein n=1 Tax=Aurantiacibacter rhizosphaerae TaxID=2691582 RepID=A0A844XH61_9SPHN|nr:hypothetical protein [Aurantiacibacter rhizosphaerae]MWV28865.1 hypothetical protein [Aurantiacibacter rhizosphaerae]
MIGKLIGAGVGAALGKETRKIGGPTGAILGAVAVPLVTRLRIPALLALAGGGYLAKRLADKSTAPAAPTTPTTPAV